MPPLIAVLLTATLFYAIIPGIGAFAVRSTWRRFRRKLVEASTRPMVSLDAVRSDVPRGEVAGDVFRFIGVLEGLQGDDHIWLRGRKLSVLVDMHDADIYLLPPADQDLTDEPPRHVKWQQMTSLTEGTRVFVAGRPVLSDGRVRIERTETDRVLVVVYDGDARTVLRRGIWSARQRNEYWNRFTPASLAAGLVALTTIGYVLIRSSADRFAALLALSFAASPLLPLLPPGVALFFVFRVLWHRGRLLRAYRDIIRLPLRHVDDGEERGRLPEGQPYVVRRLSPTEAAEYRRNALEITNPLHRGTGEVAVVAVCGQASADGGDAVAVPDDPMSELVVVDGDPSNLARRCEQQAQQLELLSMAALSVGLVGNLYLVFWLLTVVFR